MELILALLTITFFIILLDKLNRGFSQINEAIRHQNDRLGDIDKLFDRLRKLEALLQQKGNSAAEVKPTEQVPATKNIDKTAKPAILENSTSQRVEGVQFEQKSQVHEDPSILYHHKEAQANEHIVTNVWGEGPPVIKTPSKVVKDYEKYIGENVINKIGIAILVLGIGFFVKYAIDKNWIGEGFRVLIGVLCGSLLLGIAHRMQKTYKAFSSVLMGGGLAVFYLTIAIGFHQYHIFNQVSAFCIMVVITGMAVALSLIYGRQEIAVLALIGGFGTPFFVANGQNNYVALFSYLLILDIGMIVLATFRKWPLLNVISYIFTVFIYSGWFIMNDFTADLTAYSKAFVYASCYYLIFFLMNVLHNIRNTKRFSGLDFTLLLSNSFLFYLIGMYILHCMHHDHLQGTYTAVLMVFNLSIAYLVHRQRNTDKNLYYLLIGFSVTFLSLFGPIQLSGSYITLYWSAELVLMLWLSQKSGILLLRIGSIITTGLAVISIFTLWLSYSYMDIGNPWGTILINESFVTGCFLIICIAAARYLLINEKENTASPFPTELFKTALDFLLFIFIYLVSAIELSTHIGVYVKSAPFYYMVMALYNFVFAMGWIFYTDRHENKTFKWFSNIFGFFLVLIYMTFYFGEVQNYLYQARQGFGLSYLIFFGVHIPALIFIGCIIFFATRNLLKLTEKAGKVLVYCYMAFTIVYISSAECFNFAVYLQRQNEASLVQIGENVSKIVFPVLWGVCAFLFMNRGMRDKNRSLRIISLVLLLVTVIKLFIHDISNASEIGKIIAFICLGILLLIISFMYQKIKKIIFDQDGTKELSK